VAEALILGQRETDRPMDRQTDGEAKRHTSPPHKAFFFVKVHNISFSVDELQVT
jgi:hypothetical protein